MRFDSPSQAGRCAWTGACRSKWQAAFHGLAHHFVSGTPLCVRNRAAWRLLLVARTGKYERDRIYPILFQTLKLRMILPSASSRPVVTIVLVLPSGVTATRELVVIRPLDLRRIRVVMIVNTRVNARAARVRRALHLVVLAVEPARGFIVRLLSLRVDAVADDEDAVGPTR